MRGKLGMAGFGIDTSRITPADAGKTGLINNPNEKTRDHPRGCGENQRILHACCAGIGSPPRMRGKLPQFVILPEQVGITPADAGKTVNFRRFSFCCQDHPRGCGENPDGCAVKCLNIGSPPRMRGKRF